MTRKRGRLTPHEAKLARELRGEYASDEEKRADLAKTRYALREVLTPADATPPPFSRKKTTLRRQRQQVYAPRATRARKLESLIKRAPYLAAWQATVERIRAAHPSKSPTSVAKLAAKWFNDYAKEYGCDKTSYKTIMRYTIDPGPNQTLPENAARLHGLKMLKK